MNPPVVSVAGFASVDRGLFRAVSKKKTELKWYQQNRLLLILLRNDLKLRAANM
jgi:hypothetical protein